MTRFITCCFCLFNCMTSLAQNTTHIGAEVAYSADFFKINDPGGRVTHPDVSSAIWGATIRRTFNKHVFLETGVYARAYKLGLAFDHNFGSGGTDRTGVLIPLRVGGRLPLFKGAIALCPVTGISFGITDEGLGGKVDGVRQWEGVERIEYEYTIHYPSQVFSLFQAGMGMDIRLGQKALLSLSTNYYGGISKILVQRIEYTPGNGTATKATQHTNGGFYTVGIGFKYEVNWF